MTISEYILENDISFASVDDIEIAKCFAEMTVLGSLVEAYSKYETICEYTTTNPAEFNIIMESATEVKVGSLVSIDSNAVYYNGTGIPAWVKSQKWYVSQITGDRAVLGKSEDGKYNIQSPINTQFIKTSSISNTNQTKILSQMLSQQRKMV